ncbi:protein kibra [Citrus sinensis]|nr:protein CURLY FLAG LEAF 1 [Citrus sinensis]XP_024042166.1 uncharacterized protein LOC18045179 [Citrus x clementina]KAH9709813.1 protein kibra [Citrus sinensis]KDO83149.1 hypothetical protein CISIN_1g029456mg [Citrus sinensis]
MTAPNMSTITESLERSLRNCSLNNHQRRSGVNGGRGIGRSSSSDDHINNNDDLQNGDATLELNSHMSLPYHWEQCLDLKTGEIYYINWRNGMKAKEDPRTTAESSGDFYYSEEEDEDEDSSYDSEESTSESSPAPSSKEHYHRSVKDNNNNNVLVVAGCKSCLMYFMVPKQVEDCPKCNGQLLHFDRSENESP